MILLGHSPQSLCDHVQVYHLEARPKFGPVNILPSPDKQRETGTPSSSRPK